MNKKVSVTGFLGPMSSLPPKLIEGAQNIVIIVAAPTDEKTIVITNQMRKALEEHKNVLVVTSTDDIPEDMKDANTVKACMLQSFAEANTLVIKNYASKKFDNPNLYIGGCDPIDAIMPKGRKGKRKW